MSTALPFAGVGEVIESPAESAAFGMKIGRLSIGGEWRNDVATGAELARRVEDAVVSAGVDTLIIRYPSEVVEIARLEAQDAYRMQYAGTILYWEDFLIEEAEVSDAVDAVVFSGGQAGDELVESAVAVISNSFVGYLNHYAYNVHLPASVARQGYVDWARRTLRDPAGAVVLLRDAEDTIAAATLRIHGLGASAIAEVELASVVSEHQGSGRYRELWTAVRRAARGLGAARLVISTQASNHRVQRAWARLGLVPLASFDTVHAIRLLRAK